MPTPTPRRSTTTSGPPSMSSLGPERVDEVWSHDTIGAGTAMGDRSAQWLGKHVAAEHVNSVLPWHDAYHEHSAEPDPRHIARHHRRTRTCRASMSTYGA